MFSLQLSEKQQLVEKISTGSEKFETFNRWT